MKKLYSLAAFFGFVAFGVHGASLAQTAPAAPATAAPAPTTAAPAATAPAAAAPATAAPAKRLFSFDFADVCLGAGQPEAAAYTPAAGSVSPVLVFLKDSEAGRYNSRSGQVPKTWENTYQDVEKTQLVACMTVKSRSKVKDCPFKMDDGATYVAELNNTVYDLTVYEAKTGKEVQKTTLDQKAGECPTFKMFSKKVEIQDADYKEALTKFVKPLVQP